MTHLVSDLMTPDPLAITAANSLHDAHNLMKEKNIRHIPVINEHGGLVGMLTQKIMIAQVMSIMANFSASALERKTAMWSFCKWMMISLTDALCYSLLRCVRPTPRQSQNTQRT